MAVNRPDIKKMKSAVCASFMILGCCTMFGCLEGEKKPDVTKVDIELQTRRLDIDLAQIDTNDVASGLRQLKQKYPDFLDFYLDTLMGFGVLGKYDNANPAISSGLRSFLTHSDIRGLFDTVIHHFPNTTKTNEELEKGFQYLKHYYPAFEVPKIVYLTSGLNQWAAFTYDSTIVGIGLDMFLGTQYPFYEAVQMPAYVIRKCSREYISANVFQAIYRDRHPFVMEGRTLLDMMLQRGKEQYFLSKIIPFADDTIRLGYTKEQLEWCVASEAQVYNFFIRDNLLYETNWQKILRYVNDGPNSTGMPAESPGNIGTWLGLQIVTAYVKQHPEISLQELLAQETDTQTFLRESKYKPK